MRTHDTRVIGSRSVPGFIGLVILALTALPAPAVAQQGWAGAPQTISAPALTGPGIDAPRVATLPDGGAIAVWTHRQGPVAVIQSARLPAGEDRWTVPDTISVPAAVTYGAVVAAGPAGDVMAVWQRSDGAHDRVQAARYDPLSGTWSAPVDLSAPGQAAFGGQVAVDGDGNAIAMWARFASADQLTVQAARFAASSETWGAVTDLVTTGALSAHIELAFDGAGNAMAVFAANGLRWARYRADTDSWVGPGILPVVGAISNAPPSLGVDQAGDAIAVWADGDIVWGVRYDHAIASWLLPVMLATTRTGASAVAVHPGGDAIAVWTRDPGPQLTVVEAARYDHVSGHWSEATLLAEEAAVYPRIDVAIDAAGNGIAVWGRRSAGSAVQSLSAARFAIEQGAWTMTAALSAGGQQAFNPHLGIDARGNARVVWCQQAGAMSAIQARSWQATPLPPAMTVVEAGPTSLVVSFAPPTTSEPMFGPTSYAYSLDDGVTWTARDPASTSSPLVIGGLVEGALYRVRLRAVNGAGGGAASAGVTAVTGAGSSAPADLRVVAVDGRSVTLAWTPPAAGVRPESYVVDGGLEPGEVLASLDTGGPAPQLTFQAPAGVFHARVVARAGGVRSPASNEVRLVVGVPEAPSAPAHLLGFAVGPVVTFSWTNTFAGGAPAGLRLHVTGAAAAVLPVPLGERFQVSGVPPGTYTVTLTAVNAAGESAPSNAVTLTVLPPPGPYPCAALPDAPTHVRAWQQGGVLSVSWSPPATGPAVTGYTVLVSGDYFGSVATVGRSLSGPVPPGTYWISVAASTVCGGGAATPQQRVVVP